MKRIIYSYLALVLAGCSTHNVQKYSDFDISDKTITVPTGSKGLKGKVKKILSQNGWELVVYDGPEIIEGSFGKDTNIKKYNTFNTRYYLYMSSFQYDVCIPKFDPAVTYEVSIIDNKSGTEILTLDGRGCEEQIVSKISKELSAK